MSGGRHSRIIRHGLFWAAGLVAYFLLQLPAYFLIGTKLDFWQLIINQLPTTILATYPLLYGILPRLLRGQAGWFVALLAGWGLATYLLANTTEQLYHFGVAPRLLGEAPGPPFSWAAFNWSSYTWFTLLVTAGSACAIKVLDGWYQQRQLQQALLQRKLHAELQLLKAQLQPTFLFNSLGTLRELTQQQSAAAPAVVLQLAALLRYLLYESPQDAVPLADEAEALRHYVALEQLRLGSRVEVSCSFSGNLGAHHLAPLLLLPLVENAFRSLSQAPQECAWLSIDLLAKRTSLTFKVINSQPATGTSAPPEPDLRSIRQRLARLYPGQHELKVVPESDTLLVVLHLELLPLPPAAAGAQLLPTATSRALP